MKDQLQQLVQQFRAWPRVVQWALAAGIGIVLFVIWNDYIYALGQRWNDKGDAIIAQVNEVRDSEQLSRRFGSMQDSIVTLGAVEVPGDEKQTTDALNRVVNSIVSEYSSDISGESFNRTKGDRLRKGSLPGIIGPVERGEKVSGELEFESSPETATQVIAELESSPDIEALTEVRLSKSGNRRVKVKVQLEAWVIIRDTGRR